MILPSPFCVVVLESPAGSARFHDALVALERQPRPPWAGWVLAAVSRTRTDVPDGDTAVWARALWFRLEGERGGDGLPRTPCPGVRLYLPGDNAPVGVDPLTVHDAQFVLPAALARFLRTLNPGETGTGAGPHDPEPGEPGPVAPVTTVAADPEPEPEPGPATGTQAAEPDPLHEPAATPVTEPEAAPEEPVETAAGPESEAPDGVEQGGAPLSDEEIGALTDEGVYGWIQTLEREYGVRPPRNSEFLPIDDIRAWLRETLQSDQVRSAWERRQQEAAERERRAELAFPTIRDHVEVPIQGGTLLRVTPYNGGYVVSARNDGIRPPEFYRSSHRSPPWRSDKIITDTRAAIATAIARVGLGAEDDAREWVGAAWAALREAVRDDPDADLAAQSPAVKTALRNLVGVRIQRGEITITEVIYAVDGHPGRVSLEFDSKSYTGLVANLNERWYNQFAPEEINATKEDWGQIKRFWGSVAEVTTVEEYSTWDGVIERFQEHLRGVHYGRTITDLLTSGFAWYDAQGTEMDSPRPGGVVWVPPVVIQDFIDKQSGELRSANALAKVLKGRGIMLGGSKKLQRRECGERLTRQAWPLSPEFVNYRPEWAQGAEEEQV
ncbi:MAG: hypothetical protein LLF90_10185 [Methanomicrobiaceae archaeon]|nr:hypothetical protein [Methanomicrobiaceae archaeon]